MRENASNEPDESAELVPEPALVAQSNLGTVFLTDVPRALATLDLVAVAVVVLRTIVGHTVLLAV